MKLIRAIATVGGFTMLSRVLGLVRDMAIAAFLGAGPVADVFLMAFKFPNFFRRLFAEGALNAAFVPIFARLYAGEGLALARQSAEQIFAVLLVALLVFVGSVELALPWLLYIIAPGFTDDPAQYHLALTLSRITFPYIIFISLAAFYSGILNSLGKFSAAAASPVLLNIIMTLALGIAYFGGLAPASTLAWGVILAGLLQFLWMRHACQQSAVKLELVRPALTPTVKQLLRAMGPGALGAGVMQINLLVDTMLASLLPAGAVSYLYYADRLNQLPLSLLGIGISTALLPLLAQYFEKGESEAAHAVQNRTLEFTLALTLPAAFALIVLAEPIISVLFERAEFGRHNVLETAKVLAAFSCGLPAYVLAKILSTTFFAQYNTKTPVSTAITAMLINIVLNLILMQPFQHVGIASATAITAWLNAGILAFRLYKTGALILDKRLLMRVPRILMAAFLMAATVYALYVWLDFFAVSSMWLHGLYLGILIATGLGSYVFFVCMLGGINIRELLRFVRPPKEVIIPPVSL